MIRPCPRPGQLAVLGFSLLMGLPGVAVVADEPERSRLAAILSEAGVEICELNDAAIVLSSDPALQRDHAETSVIALCEGPRDMTAAFSAGADDVLMMGASGHEVIARIAACARRPIATRDVQLMLDATQALASSQDVRGILYTLVSRVAELVAADRVSLILMDEDDPSRGRVIVASDDRELRDLPLELTKYPEIAQVLKTGEHLEIIDAANDPLLEGVREEIPQVGLGTIRLFPLLHEGRPIGVLFLRAPTSSVASRRELVVCQILANATALSLQNARVLQSLRDDSARERSQRTLAERQLVDLRRFADLFASAAEGIALFSREGTLQFANPRAYEILGYTEDTLAVKKAEDVVHPDDLHRGKRVFAAIGAGDYPRGVDLRVVRANGETAICSCSFAVLKDNDAILISLRDVTEQRRTESELVKTMEFLESLIDATLDGIVAADLAGNIILFNRSAEAMLGLPASSVIGQRAIHDLFPDSADEMLALLATDDHDGVGRLTKKRVNAVGANGPIPVRLSAATIYEQQEPVATFAVLSDLRERIEVEERLADAQQRLEVTEKQALIAELAGTAAHELNQPLTSVMWCAELIKRALSPDSSEFRAADTMISEAERMAEIVRKIGTMTKYETKSYVGEQKIIDLEKSGDAPEVS